MTESACPYLLRERTAFRESLDLSRKAPFKVVVTWHCTHPFHGIRLDLGDTLAHVALHCSACTLPRSGGKQRRDEPQRRQPVAGGE